MGDPTNDIDSLQAQLMKAREDEGWFITGDQAKDFSRALTALVAERDAAIKERDAARRMICEDESYNHKSGVTPREVAEDRGWDCFAQKEEGGA